MSPSFECFPVECRWRISAQSSKLITFHDGWWPCFQLALTASVSDIFRVFHERINAGALIIAITRKTVPT